MRQRQTSPFILLPLLHAALGCGAPLYAEADVVVPLPSNPVFLSEAQDHLFVSLSLSGLAWFQPDEPQPELQYRPDLLTLDVIEFRDGQLLLAGRDSKIRVARLDNEELKIEYEWEAEGIPTSLARDGKILAVAAGGAGVSIYQWEDFTRPPSLAGRYPFINYARQIEFFDADTLFVADSESGTATFIDISDPLRPRKRVAFQAISYCDSVAVHGNSVAYTDRLVGTVYQELALAEPTGKAWSFRALEGENPSHVQSVFFRQDTMVIAEKHEGVRLFSWRENNWVESGRDSPALPVIHAILLEDGRIAIAEGKQVRITPGPEAEK